MLGFTSGRYQNAINLARAWSRLHILQVYLFIFAEMGIQTSTAFLKDKRVPLAGGTHCLCDQEGGRG